jgi:OOP family OmpA-OmpF porin
MKSVVETAREALTGPVVTQMSALLHESEGNTRQAFETAVPLSVAGLASSASTEAGAQALLRTFERADYVRVDPADLGRTVADPRAAQQVVSSSEGVMSRLFGNKLGGVVDGLAGEGGVSRSSASKLLALATPVVMSIVGRTAASRNLDARGLAGFLGEQLRLAGGAIPRRMAGMLGMTPALAGGPGLVARHGERVVRLPRQGGRRSLMPWLLAGIALLAGMFWLSARRQHRPTEQVVATAPARPTAPAVPAPALPAPVAAVPEDITALSSGGGTAALSRVLEGTEPLPARFVISDLNFRYNSAEIEPGTTQVLDEVAAALRAHPTAKVRVEDHTESSGDNQADMVLSQERSESVKAYLTEHGVSGDRLEAAGHGPTQPLAADDTAGGRGQNRRTELVVTER